MKYRLVQDHHSPVENWHQIQWSNDGGKTWMYFNSGSREEMQKVFDRIRNTKDRYSVVAIYEEPQPLIDNAAK